MSNTAAEVKIFALSEPILDELETALSPERFATYLAATGGDRGRAVRLYTWNTAASAAFYGPLQALEVTLRNGFHRNLAVRYGADWYDNPAIGLDLGCLKRVAQAKKELTRSGYAVDPPHVVADLSFGFWVSLLGSGGFQGPGRTRKANYEMTLWRPALRAAFPHAPKMNRKAAHAPLDYLRTFRNRIAHHEPVFGRHLEKDYDSILEIAGWMSPEKRDWIDAHSRVREILAQPRDDGGIRF